MSQNKKELKIKFVPAKLWRWWRWEIEGIDPWNKYHWKIFTPLIFIGLFDPTIPDRR
jgi:hypothetical protein